MQLAAWSIIFIHSMVDNDSSGVFRCQCNENYEPKSELFIFYPPLTQGYSLIFYDPHKRRSGHSETHYPSGNHIFIFETFEPRVNQYHLFLWAWLHPIGEL